MVSRFLLYYFSCSKKDEYQCIYCKIMPVITTTIINNIIIINISTVKHAIAQHSI